MKDVSVATLEAFQEEAHRFVSALKPRGDKATLVTLSGELGAGKTTFTQSVASALGVEEHVTSPTFVLEKIYDLPAARSAAGFARLVHIDAYRLESGADLAPLSFDEIMKDPRNLILLEWPEKVSDQLPTPTTSITLTVSQDGSRNIAYA